MGYGDEPEIRWITTPEEYRALDAQRGSMPPNAVRTVFLTQPWLRNWMDGYGVKDLRVLTAWEDDRLVAELPLVERPGGGRSRVWTFAGAGELTPNHLDVIGDPRATARAMPGFVRALMDASDSWDVLDLDKLDGQGFLATFMRESFDSLGYATDSAEAAICPYADLPDTYEEYLRSRGKATRRHAGQALRRLQRKHPDARFEMADSEESVIATMDALTRLHQARWTARGHVGAFAEPRFTEFHRKTALEAFRQGFLRLYSLNIEGDVAAVGYCYRVGDRVEAYQTGFDEAWGDHGPGILLLAHTLERSILEGVRRFDHLEGQESYKSSWCSGRHEDVRLRVYNRTARGTLAQMKSRAVDAGIAFARRNVPAHVRQAFLREREKVRLAMRQSHIA